MWSRGKSIGRLIISPWITLIIISAEVGTEWIISSNFLLKPSNNAPMQCSWVQTKGHSNRHLPILVLRSLTPAPSHFATSIACPKASSPLLTTACAQLEAVPPGLVFTKLRLVICCMLTAPRRRKKTFLHFSSYLRGRWLECATMSPSSRLMS